VIREVGTQVQLLTVIRDLTGAATNAPTVALSLIAPDGSITAPVVTNTAANGIYTATATPSQAGLYRYTWTASGAVVDVQSDQFTTVAAARGLVASLEELKTSLAKTTTADDLQLRGHLHSATDWVEWRIGGPVVPTTITERILVDVGAWSAFPRKRPLISVTSMTNEYTAVVLDSASYTVDTNLSEIRFYWQPLPGWYTTIYRAGLSAIAERVKLAGLELARHLWAVQNGSAGRGYPGEEMIQTPMGFAVPRRVDELLTPDNWVLVG
jgi:hypothetical protein